MQKQRIAVALCTTLHVTFILKTCPFASGSWWVLVGTCPPAFCSSPLCTVWVCEQVGQGGHTQTHAVERGARTGSHTHAHSARRDREAGRETQRDGDPGGTEAKLTTGDTPRARILWVAHVGSPSWSTSCCRALGEEGGLFLPRLLWASAGLGWLPGWGPAWVCSQLQYSSWLSNPP